MIVGIAVRIVNERQNADWRSNFIASPVNLFTMLRSTFATYLGTVGRCNPIGGKSGFNEYWPVEGSNSFLKVESP